MDEEEITVLYEAEKEKALAKLEAAIANDKSGKNDIFEKQFRAEMKKAKERYDKMMKMLNDGQMKKVKSRKLSNPFNEKESGNEGEKKSIFSFLNKIIGRGP